MPVARRSPVNFSPTWQCDMSTDTSTPQGNTLNPNADDLRREWEEFRNATFTLIGPAQDCTVWIWASASPFDFAMVGAQLRLIPDVRVNLGLGALAISLDGAAHLIPLDRLAPSSVDAMQPHATFDIRARQAEILSTQQAAIEKFLRLHGARLQANMPVTGMGEQQLH